MESSQLAAPAGLQAYTSATANLVLTVVADDLGASGQGAGRTERSAEFTPEATPFPWSNESNQYDVDDDGNIIPRDVGRILSDIVLNGSRDLETPGPEGPYAFLDVFGDNRVAPQDILLVLNEILRQNNGEGESSPWAAPPETTVARQEEAWDRLVADASFWRELALEQPGSAAPPPAASAQALADWLRDSDASWSDLEVWLRRAGQSPEI